MQRTEKYFEQDAFRTECESVILAAEPDEKTGGKFYHCILYRFCNYHIFTFKIVRTSPRR